MSRAVGGALAWLSVAHFFVAEELVRRSWTIPYSRRTNYLSDLGATTCGPFYDRKICSPGHSWMNLSFGLVGIAIIAGALLLRPVTANLTPRPLPLLYVAGGVGSVLVGLFPLDTVRPMHALGAGMFFVGINLAHVLLGLRLSRRQDHWYGVGLILVGAVGLVGAVLVFSGTSLGLGVGFVQRITSYGTLVGIIASALVLLTRAARPGRLPASPVTD